MKDDKPVMRWGPEGLSIVQEGKETVEEQVARAVIQSALSALEKKQEKGEEGEKLREEEDTDKEKTNEVENSEIDYPDMQHLDHPELIERFMRQGAKILKIWLASGGWKAMLFRNSGKRNPISVNLVEAWIESGFLKKDGKGYWIKV